jgi:hypothetical protein
MHAALQIGEVLATIMFELRVSPSSLAALSSTIQLFFAYARPELWWTLPGYGPLARLMPRWSWKMLESSSGKDYMVCCV